MQDVSGVIHKPLSILIQEKLNVYMGRNVWGASLCMLSNEYEIWKKR